MGAEEPSSLATDLDALETHKGPEKHTCVWWREASEAEREAVVRNAARLGHTGVANFMRARGIRVTQVGIRDHASGTCSCQRD